MVARGAADSCTVQLGGCGVSFRK